MAKFKKFSTVDGVIVLVPSPFYNRCLYEISSSLAGIYQTRRYVYFLDSDGVMWRHPSKMELSDSKVSGSLERVISQWSFNPEVYFV